MESTGFTDLHKAREDSKSWLIETKLRCQALSKLLKEQPEEQNPKLNKLKDDVDADLDAQISALLQLKREIKQPTSLRWQVYFRKGDCSLI